jgi:hypothetical protein
VVRNANALLTKKSGKSEASSQRIFFFKIVLKKLVANIH